MRSDSHAVYTRIVITILAVVFPFTNLNQRVAAHAAVPREVRQSLTADAPTLPVPFVENRGQVDARVRYYARGHRFGFFLTPDAMTVALDANASGRALALSLRFAGANTSPRMEGVGAEGEANYFHGNDPSAWRTRVPQYDGVVYRALWPGIDLHVRERGGVLKYEFHVQPGARASDVRVVYDGATTLSIDAAGALLIRTPHGTIQDAAPVAYQVNGSTRLPVDASYALGSSSILGSSSRRFSAAPASRAAHRSSSTPAATPTSRARRSPPTSRPRPERSIAPARPRTSPKRSCRS
jgi:hypothetical protein